MFRFRSLHANFLALIVPISLLLFGLIVGTFEWLNYQQARAGLRDKLQRISSSQSIILSEAVWRRDDDLIPLIVASIIADPDVGGIAVFGRGGEPLDTFGTGWETDGELVQRTTITYAHDAALETVGMLALALTDERVARSTLERLYQEFGLALLLLLASIVSAQLAQRSTVGVALAKLVRSMGESTHERPYEPVQWQSRDEVGRVVDAYNDLQLRQRDYEAELRNTHQELREALALAESASAAKDQFLAQMSHEIRTPMNGVLGMTELLLNTQLTEQQQRFAQTVDTSARSLLGIINDVLDLSKIEAGKLAIEHVPFDPTALLDDVHAMFGELAASKQLDFTVQTEPGLATTFIGDPGRLQQVLTNLVGNALKFTERGAVCITASAHGGELRFAVSDTGIGIAAQAAERIFDAFVQADSSTSRRFDGTGLGLSIARQLVTLMGGEIGVESTPGVGALFWFTIPATRPQASQVLVPEVAVSFGSGTAPARAEAPGRRVLVVEDHPVNQLLTREMLMTLGCEVLVAENGEQALHRCVNESFDLVLMDCRMPGMDGYEATRRIRHHEQASGVGEDQRTPIVAVTADAMPEDRRRCLDAGMDDYLSKPICAADLGRMLERWCYARTALPEAAPA